jgi:hypothetical protein
LEADFTARLRSAIVAGQLVDLRSGDPEVDKPATCQEWDPRRTVSAALLADLLTEVQDSRRRALRLAGARITGDLDLEAVDLDCPVLLEDCCFEKPVSFAEASVPSLRMPGCHLPALNAAQLDTRGDLGLNDGFIADGVVNLRGAHIGGNLQCNGATLRNPSDYALVGDRLIVDHNMFCRLGFSANGMINLVSAHIKGNLELDGATLTNPDGLSLYADGLVVDRGLFLRRGVTAQGGIRFVAAEIGRQLEIVDATLDGVLLDLEQLVTPSLLLRRLRKAPKRLNLVAAQLKSLVDDSDSWPREIKLLGLTYEFLYEHPPVTVLQRLDWLTRDPDGYSPQPYEQLAAAYRRAGREHDARTIAIAKQRARRHTFTKQRGLRRLLAWPGSVWSLLLDVLVGYGYRTWLAGVWLFGLMLIGSVVFARAYPGQMTSTGKPGDPQPTFQPAIYALDTLLPIIDLRQQNYWIPRGGAQWWAWISIILGWVLTTAVVAALTGIIKRD